MDVTTTFLPILQVFAAEMTKPTFQSFQTLIGGWIFAPRQTVRSMIRASGTDRHWSGFYRLFSRARWSLDRVGLAVFDLLTGGMTTVFLVGDDTLLARRGLKIFGTGMHRDPLLSSRSHTVTRWGHCWVVLCVVFESRRVPGHRFALPVMCRLYLNKKSAWKWDRVYRTKNDLMIEMLQRLDRHTSAGEKRLHFVGDSAFTAPAVLDRIPASIAVTGRVGANVRIHEPPPCCAGKVGRPRKRGDRLATPKEMLGETGLRRITLKPYNNRTYKMRVAEQTGRFYKAPDRDVKVIAVEHLTGGRGTEVFYTTDIHDGTGVETTAETVLTRYSWRWPVEVTFHDAKQHLGVDQPQNRTRLAARRTAPTGFLLYSLIVWWHETIRADPAPLLRFWPNKPGPSFAEMFAAFKADSLEITVQNNLTTPAPTTGVQKIIDHLKYLLTLAA